MQNGEPVIRVEDKAVEPHRLAAELRKLVGDTKKNILLLKHDDDVPQSVVIQIIDDANGVGINSVKLLLPPARGARK
jgi:biopolymer transport protein ExbD